MHWLQNRQDDSEIFQLQNHQQISMVWHMPAQSTNTIHCWQNSVLICHIVSCSTLMPSGMHAWLSVFWHSASAQHTEKSP